MGKAILITGLLLLVTGLPGGAETGIEKDIVKTDSGDLEIFFIGHGTLMFKYGGKVIHVDPFSRLADYSKMPEADIIIITHEHGDHLDPGALDLVRTERTLVVLSSKCAEQVEGGIVMKNGDVRAVGGLRIEAVPAYNIVHMRSKGSPFHPKGVGNGYVIQYGNKRVYVAGDTENTPEMKQLENVDVAFLPMNLPYTMTPEMVADAATAFRPGILYPYHYGDTEPAKILELLKDEAGIEVRIRRMR